MKKYLQLLKLLYLTIKVWHQNELQEEQEVKCEYCDQAVFNNTCSHCKRKQPKFKLSLTHVTKQGYYIDAWNERLGRNNAQTNRTA